jgi:predicted O-methyltransferase YrrM
MLSKAIKKLPYIRSLVKERDQLHGLVTAWKRHLRYVPPGHFYSPIPNLDYVRANEAAIFGSTPEVIPGVDLAESAQLQLLEEFKRYYAELPFTPHKTPPLRYFFENPAYSYSDAITLYCMIRHAQPKRIVEIGSGYSSCAMLDTNELFFSGGIKTTFIEPYPELLLSLIRPSDQETIALIPSKLQDVGAEVFQSLEANDILFVDSTHVCRIHSDVNRILFEILPSLKSGVYVHFHDIFYPFEYPKEWVYEGRAWNEAYALRAFLQFNSAFRIVFFNTYLEHFHRPFFEKHMPLCLKNLGGSLWIQRL